MSRKRGSPAAYGSDGEGSGNASDAGSERAPAKASKRAKLSADVHVVDDGDDGSDDFQMDLDYTQDLASLAQPLEEDDSIVQQYEAAHRLQTQSTDKQVAEAGAIERVELFNFMCHKRLDVRLGPNLNFIVGHNGSGKSAILTAITIVLGSRASDTNRAASMKAFVKSGESGAEIVLTLKNRGPEAYRHDVYGDRIIIERRIGADGGGSWKIKSGIDGKVKSNKREELDAICDHLDIQTDNPLSVLSQDNARQFLSAASPQSLYNFFLKGTLLTQLAREMGAMKENVHQIRFANKRREEDLPALQRVYEEKCNTFAQYEKTRQVRKKLDDLSVLYVWSQVQETRKTVEKARARAEDLEANYNQAEHNRAKAAENLEIINNTIAELEEQNVVKDELDRAIIDEEAELRAKVDAKEREVTAARTTTKRINDEYMSHKNLQGETQTKLDAELMKGAQQGDRERLANRRREILAEMEAIRKDLRAADMEKAKLDGEAHLLRANEVEAESARKGEQMTLRGIEQHLSRATAASRDMLAAHGEKMAELVKWIDKEKGWVQPPLGPIGRLVTVRDEKWVPIIESVLDKLLDAFIVTNDHDRTLLTTIMRRSRITYPIIKGVDEKFDCTSGEPPEEITTVLRMLRSEHDLVLRQLVIARRIESAVLVDNRVEAEKLLAAKTKNVLNCFTSEGLHKVSTTARGGLSTSAMTRHKVHRLTRDQSRQIEALREARAAAERAKGLAENRLQQVKAAVREKDAQVRQVQQRINEMRTELNGKNSEVEGIVEEISAMTTESSATVALQNILKDCQEKMAETRTRFQTAMATQQALEMELDDLTAKQQAAQDRVDERSGRQKQLASLAEKEALKRVKASNEVAHWQGSVTKYKELFEQAQEALKNDQLDLDDLVQQARQETGLDDLTVPRNRSPASLEKEISALENVIAAHQREQGGMTLEVAKQQLDDADAALEEAKAKTATLRKFADRLVFSIDERMRRWFEWRSLIALRTKALFGVHLEHRNYKGSLQFYHSTEGNNEGRLVIKVITDIANAGEGKQSRRDKDPKSLSGGEKSFSTICLLLSLWDAMSCPIRCLDEFDVFMDASNRSISTKLIMDAGQSSSRTQYILISPQSLTNANIGPQTRIIHMKDPGRGQTTLD